MFDNVEQGFRLVAEVIALAIQAGVVVIVTIGAIEAAKASLTGAFRGASAKASLRTIWLRFASWVLLALEFALAADVIRTAIAPSWDDIGKLGAIALIRTGLSFFLARDIEEVRTAKPKSVAQKR